MSEMAGRELGMGTGVDSGVGADVGLAATVMVLGTSSDAGKSWVTGAICRMLSEQGYSVAPFKAQNMNSVGVEVDIYGGDGRGQISVSQFVQTVAAGCVADTRMNPVLVKPTSDTSSVVVLNGVERPDISEMPWRDRREILWPHVCEALDSLRRDFDVVVIEGAGSPAEINLMGNDIVNMSVARYVQAPSLLVADIDRGGAFAHLYGTWALVEEQDRHLIKGFVLNKFRGDAALLDPAPKQLAELTGVDIFAVIPMLGAQDSSSSDASARGSVITDGLSAVEMDALEMTVRSSAEAIQNCGLADQVLTLLSTQ